MMNLVLQDEQGQRFLEGSPGQSLIERDDDVSTVLEACFAHAVDRMLLYAENMPSAFFDLSSGEAGAILQKFRTYRVRLALVRSPTLHLSRRFAELLVDEQRARDFRVFDNRAAAAAWLRAL